MSLFFVVLSLLLFAIILRFYLNEFSKYFKEINRSIDALIEENSGDIVLPSELTAIEKKINHIKHTLEQRKLAAELSEQRKNDLVVYLAHDLKNPTHLSNWVFNFAAGRKQNFRRIKRKVFVNFFGKSRTS